MDNLNKGFEFLNLESVCPAEKEILQSIIHGDDAEEYSKHLFAFDSPYCIGEYGDGEFTRFPGEVVEVSAEHGHEMLSAIASHHPGIVVSQGNIHGNNFYGAHPRPGPATSIPSAAPPNMLNSPSGVMNPFNIMYQPAHAHSYPHQPFFQAPAGAYYGSQQGTNQAHMPYTQVESQDGAYIPPQNHKVHDPNYAGGGGGGSGSGNAYKGRRKQPQPPQYFYQNYYTQVPYFNQQQLQNVTGPPIIMSQQGLYMHQQGMYSQGPVPQVGEMEHHQGVPNIVPIPEMNFAQHHHASPQMFSPSSPSRSYNHPPPPKGSPSSSSTAQSDSSSRSVVKEVPSMIEKHITPASFRTATNVEMRGTVTPPPLLPPHNSTSSGSNTADSADTPKSLPDLSKSNGTLVLSPGADTLCWGEEQKEQQLQSPAPETKSIVIDTILVNGADSVGSLAAHSQNHPSGVVEEATGAPPPSMPSFDNDLEIVVPSVHANGGLVDCVLKQSTNRDKSADVKSKSDVNREQVKSSNSSSESGESRNKSGSYRSAAATATNNNNSDTNSSPVLSAEKIVEPPSASSPKSVGITTATTSSASDGDGGQNAQNEAKAGRSWASIASVKTLNNGASTRIPHNNQEPEGYKCSSPFPPGTIPGFSDKPWSSGGVGGGVESCSDGAAENDPVLMQFAEHLEKYTLDHQSIPLTPRGLYNSTNSCYFNSILQALLSCPTFVNLFRSMPQSLLKAPSGHTALINRHTFQFVREFVPLQLQRQNIPKREKAKDIINPDPSVDPTALRSALRQLSEDKFMVEGRQEDAEECLSYWLNALHDEMIKAAKLLESKREEAFEKKAAASAAANGEAEDDDDQWQLMGARNKSCLTRKTEITKSPISEAFFGQLCLSLNQVNCVKKAALEPFMTLKLEIQNENIKSVRDALDAFSIKEEVCGVKATSGNEVEAWRQQSLEELPPILILHLKRFVYEKNGIHKINKKLDYGVDLEIGKELLSNNSKTKYTLKQRQYKLFAVVYHDGEDAHKGHYIADCFHPSSGSRCGQWGWLRYDDTSVKPISEASMLNPPSPRVPYLLFYRRQDTIVQQQLRKGS